MHEITQHTGDIPFVAVANKCDLDEMEWKLSISKIENWCNKHNMKLYMVSAKDATNVETAFITLSESALNSNRLSQEFVLIL